MSDTATPPPAETLAPFPAMPGCDEGPIRFDPMPGYDDAPICFPAVPGDRASYDAMPAAPPSAPVITARLRAHLAKQPGGACSFCGGSHWKPYAWAQIVLYSGPDAEAVPTKTIPALHLECDGCGFIATINATAAGILVAATE